MGMQQRFTWATAALVKETKDALTIVFDTKGQSFAYKPGQFINLRFTIKGKEVIRSYSLCTTHGIDKAPAITIKRVAGGLVSNYLLRHVYKLKSWHVEGPFGFFTPVPEDFGSPEVNFIAGGSGITPIYAIIKHLLLHTDSKLTLIYCSRTWKETIFGQGLLKWQDRFPERFKIVFTFSKENAETVLIPAEVIRGRLSKLVLKKILKQTVANLSNSPFFLCGPAGIIELAEAVLQSLEVPTIQIRKEYFTEQETEATKTTLPDTLLEVQLHFYERTNLLEVNPGQTILQAALEERIEVPNSCKAGTCGVCAGKLTKGKVHMQKNFALGETHLKDGLVLLCQSYPLTENVTVEVG